ncbi:MAG: DMT family transporter [Leptolyngbyaceae cyanobacterium CSU_1_3]|nr:DMT family transporter [Leptolyngbyaceae cyanobacterium CSU_1_3]
MSLHRSSGRWQLGFGLALLTTFLWGILPIALTIALQSLNPYTLTWFRFLVSFGLLAVYLAGSSQLPNLRNLSARLWSWLAIATIFLGLNYLLFLEGLSRTSPATGGVFNPLSSTLMGLGALAIFKERYTLRQWVGLGILLAGMMLFFQEQLRTIASHVDRYLVGVSIFVVASLAWAIYALVQKQLLRTLPSSAIMLVIYGGSALLLTPMATPQEIFTLDLFQWAILGFCTLNTLVAYGAFAEALEHLDASRVSAIIALTPIITISAVLALSFLFPKLDVPNHLSAVAIVGAGFVVVGSLTIALGKIQPIPSD